MNAAMTDDLEAFVLNLLYEFGEDPESAMLLYGCAPEGELGGAIRFFLSGWLIGFTGLHEAIGVGQ